MNRLLQLAAGLLLLVTSTVVRADPLLLCGMDEVFAIDLAAAEKGKLEKLWSWRARDRAELPEALRKTFGTTDECKPVRDGKQILITSSGGGCALVDYPAGTVRWHARVPNAHSIELLPENRVVVASSTSGNGNRLVLFDLARSDEPLWHTPLVSAHGVVWDEAREVLWALGLKELRRYRLKDWDSKTPSLDLGTTWPLPDEDGHDLQPVPGTNDLVVSTGRHVYLFDRAAEEFRPHPDLSDVSHVKSVALHPTSGGVVFTEANDEHWWMEAVQVLPGKTPVPITGERIYKVRWLVGPAGPAATE